jgi:hypothetical protein
MPSNTSTMHAVKMMPRLPNGVTVHRRQSGILAELAPSRLDGRVTINFTERLTRLRSTVYEELRPAQAHVLVELGTTHLSDADVGVELPTGEGKTLIALLLADWALDQGMSVAYLTGTRNLAEQVEGHAESLPGIEVRRFAGGHYPGAHLDDYHQAQAVGVMNYWVYFNSSPRVEPADLVIFDDAHLAEQPLSGMFTLRVPRMAGGGSDLYTALCDLLLAQAPAAYPTLTALRDGTAPPGSPPELIAFNDWSAVADSASDLIDVSQLVRDNDDARYPWRAIKPYLTRCGVLVGPSVIEIRPYHPPTQTVPGYANSRKRLYLSATLGRAGDLQRRLGVKPMAVVETPQGLRSATTGRRTFLVNPSPSVALDEGPLGFALEQADAAANDGPGRVAWLCASNSEADSIEAILRSIGKPVHRLRAGDDAAVDRWRVERGSHLVTAGRFDGLDFPDDVCRLVIVPSVPAASSEFERFAVAYLGDATYMRHRVGQRVTQALGRANRTTNDSALYLGLDPAFGSVLAESAVRQSLSSDVAGAVRAALELHGGPWQPVRDAAAHFWRLHRDPLETPSPAAAGARPGRRASGSSTSDSAASEVESTTRFWLGDMVGAAEHAEAAADILHEAGEPEHSAFWRYVQAHALFELDTPAQLAGAKQAIQRAVEAAPRTAWFIRLTRTAADLAGRTVDPTGYDSLFLAWDEWLRESTPRLPARIAEARGWLSGTHDQRCDALVVLARLCGVAGDRPTGQSASDNRWVWATSRKGHRRVWEIKTTKSDKIPRDDINQLLGQVQEEQIKHPRATVSGCLLSDMEEPENDARAASRNLTLLHTDAATVMFDTMSEVFHAYRTAWGAGTAAERGSARATTEPRLPNADWLTQLLAPSGGRVLRAQDARNLIASSS